MLSITQQCNINVLSDLQVWETVGYNLLFYVLHYGSQYFNGLKEKVNVPNKSSVQLDLCFCSLALEISFSNM